MKHADVLEILDDFATCQMYTKHHARSFYFASFALPKHKRNAAYALYAFCRYADNSVDSASGQTDVGYSLERIRDLRTLLDHLYDSKADGSSGLDAFSHTITQYAIPKEYFLDLLRGVEMDLTRTRYETFAQLSEYCYCVASVVGLMMTKVFGASDPSALSYAADLGTAMQLTNILRDIREDFAMGRIYLPAEDLRAFGYTEDDLRANRLTPEFRALMSYEIARARQYYARANTGITLLTDDGSRFCARLMSEIYSTILDRIEEEHYDVFSTRAFVPLSQKLRIAGLVVLGAPTSIRPLADQAEFIPGTGDFGQRRLGSSSAF